MRRKFFDVLWWIEDNVFWRLKAKFTGRCFICGLKDGTHKFSCDGCGWGADE